MNEQVNKTKSMDFPVHYRLSDGVSIGVRNVPVTVECYGEEEHWFVTEESQKFLAGETVKLKGKLTEYERQQLMERHGFTREELDALLLGVSDGDWLCKGGDFSQEEFDFYPTEEFDFLKGDVYSSCPKVVSEYWRETRYPDDGFIENVSQDEYPTAA